MIRDSIMSVRETIGRDYTKPDPKKLEGFKRNLTEDSKAYKYLTDDRGLTKETIIHFELGYDTEKDAVAIPIYKDGELINIKYRLLEPKDHKYLGEKNAETWLFNEAGLKHAEEHKPSAVLIVEGEFDAIACWQAGIRNVISTASGKDSYGVWVQKLDSIGRVYVAFDNDKGGRETSRTFAERVGQKKCREIVYPDGFKDANDFFKVHNIEDFRNLVKDAKPYYSYDFKNIGDVINELRKGEGEIVTSKWIPNVKMEKDWLVVLSGDTNIGKTSYSMNVARDIAEQGKPVLVMPFERGIVSVGKRFLQVLFNKTSEDFAFTPDKEWDSLIDKVINLPVYFSVPKKNDVVDIIRRSVRYFGVKVVIIDHLDYIIRHTGGNRENEIANTLQDYKRIAEELGVVMIIVTHLRKRETGEKPTLQDLKGSSSLSQDPECVVLLSSEEAGVITVDIAKNKGYMQTKDFGIRLETGVMNTDPDDW